MCVDISDEHRMRRNVRRTSQTSSNNSVGSEFCLCVPNCKSHSDAMMIALRAILGYYDEENCCTQKPLGMMMATLTKEAQNIRVNKILFI